jgi:hypothetical protein
MPVIDFDQYWDVAQNLCITDVSDDQDTVHADWEGLHGNDDILRMRELIKKHVVPMFGPEEPLVYDLVLHWFTSQLNDVGPGVLDEGDSCYIDSDQLMHVATAIQNVVSCRYWMKSGVDWGAE